MDKLLITILTPKETLFKDWARYIQLPGRDGYFGVLPNHSPLFAALKKGKIKIKKENQELQIESYDGFASICDNKIIVLIDGYASITNQ